MMSYHVSPQELFSTLHMRANIRSNTKHSLRMDLSYMSVCVTLHTVCYAPFYTPFLYTLAIALILYSYDFI